MQVLSVDPNNTDALLILGHIYSDSLLANPPKAVHIFKRVLQLRPSHDEAISSLAMVYARIEQCREATDILDSLSESEVTHNKVAMEVRQACSMQLPLESH